MLSIAEFSDLYPNLALFAKEKGWRCGKSFISYRNRCYTNPNTGKKLGFKYEINPKTGRRRKVKVGLTYKEYQKARTKAVKKKGQGKKLTSLEQKYIADTQRLATSTRKKKQRRVDAKRKRQLNKKLSSNNNSNSQKVIDYLDGKIEKIKGLRRQDGYTVLSDKNLYYKIYDEGKKWKNSSDVENQNTFSRVNSYEVQTAYTVKEAIDKIKNSKYLQQDNKDLVIIARTEPGNPYEILTRNDYNLYNSYTKEKRGKQSSTQNLSQGRIPEQGYGINLNKYMGLWKDGRPYKTGKTSAESATLLKAANPETINAQYKIVESVDSDRQHKKYRKQIQAIADQAGYEVIGDKKNVVIKGTTMPITFYYSLKQKDQKADETNSNVLQDFYNKLNRVDISDLKEQKEVQAGLSPDAYRSAMRGQRGRKGARGGGYGIPYSGKETKTIYKVPDLNKLSQEDKNEYITLDEPQRETYAKAYKAGWRDHSAAMTVVYGRDPDNFKQSLDTQKSILETIESKKQPIRPTSKQVNSGENPTFKYLEKYWLKDKEIKKGDLVIDGSGGNYSNQLVVGVSRDGKKYKLRPRAGLSQEQRDRMSKKPDTYDQWVEKEWLYKYGAKSWLEEAEKYFYKQSTGLDKQKPGAVEVSIDYEAYKTKTDPQLIKDKAKTENPSIKDNERTKSRNTNSTGNLGKFTTPEITTARQDLVDKAIAKRKPSEIPEELKPHLTDKQQLAVGMGVSAMETQKGFLLADGTGVGKTRSQLATAKIFADSGKKVLIVSKAEVLKPKWRKSGNNEVSGSFKEDAETMGIEYKVTKDGKDIKPGEIGLSTYSNVKKLKESVDKDTTLIFDEAHSFKNEKSARTQHGMEMIGKADSVLYATATPADKPEHIDYLFKAGVFNGNTKEQTYKWLGMEQKEISIGYGRKVYRWQKRKDVTAEEMIDRLNGLFDSMTENGNMLKREISLKGVETKFKQVSVPQEARDALNRIESAYSDRKDPLAKAQMLMHQRRQLEPYKVPAAVEMVKDAIAQGRKPVIFVSRVNESTVTNPILAKAKSIEDIQMLSSLERQGLVDLKSPASSEGTAKLLREALKKEGITKISEIHGGSKEKPDKAMKDFQSGKTDVVIATVESGGTGINLDDRDGDKPRSLIMLTPPFSAVENVQAAGRVWRLKTKSYPEINYIFSDTSVDTWNRNIISKKMKSLGAVVSGEIGKLDADNAKSVDKIAGTTKKSPRIPEGSPEVNTAVGYAPKLGASPAVNIPKGFYVNKYPGYTRDGQKVAKGEGFIRREKGRWVTYSREEIMRLNKSNYAQGISYAQFSVLYPNLAEFRVSDRNLTKRSTFKKTVGGWECGKTFIPANRKCWTHPTTGRKLKTPLNYQQYTRLRKQAYGKSRSGKVLTDYEQKLVKSVERKQTKIAKKKQQQKLQSAAKAVGARQVLSTGIAEANPNLIAVDPKRFQYKISGRDTSSGSVGSLKGVRKWDANLAGIVQVWQDPKNKKVYVVNGHNRLDLAKKLDVPQVTVRFLKAKSAPEARAIGALTNIAEGRGNAQDAAKFFRDSGLSKADLDKKGIPMREAIATNGLALSNLSDGLFNQVVQGQLQESRAVVIGSKLNDKVQQEALVKLIAKEEKRGRRITNDVISELADMTSSSPKKVESEQGNIFSLLGFDPDERSLVMEKAQVSASIKRQLVRDKKLFGTVGKSKAAKDLSKAGNKINIEESAAISKDAETTLTLFDKVKNYRGGVDDALNKAAERLANGESPEKVKREAYQEVSQVLQKTYKYGETKRTRSSQARNKREYAQMSLQTLNEVRFSVLYPNLAGRLAQ